jgi:uncharacterized membrane protein (UPF0127 family)
MNAGQARCDQSLDSSSITPIASFPHWQIVHRSSGRLIVGRLEIADRPWSRLLGWQYRRRPPIGSGLLIIPCRSVHTCFVRFPLDLVGLDAEGCIAGFRPAIRPWRAVWLPRTVHAVLELPADADQALVIGDRLLAVPADPARLPPMRASLQFLLG